MSKKGSITTSDYLPYEEYQRFVQILEDKEDYVGAAYCIMSFAFALRISDIKKIRWCQVLGQKSLVVQEQKTGKTKRIPIGEKTEESLRRIFLKAGLKDTNTLVVTNKKGKSMSSQYINRWLKSCKNKYKLKIDNFSSHTFRKTLGRYVYNKMGKTQESLMLLNRVFNHASINVTMVYLGIRDDEINEIFQFT